jgi:hypothetical protein
MKLLSLFSKKENAVEITGLLLSALKVPVTITTIEKEFAGGLFTLLTVGIINPQALFVLAWLNVLAVPYVFFSISYQWLIAKQWCVLCLSVQGLLVLQLFTALSAGWHTSVTVDSVFTAGIMMPVIFSYLIPLIVVSLLLPAYRAARESKHNKIELQRLKHNPLIFQSLLVKQKALTESPDGLGILLGHPDAMYKIIKVCNPHCGPCANAHQPVEDLLHNNADVQIQIIFTVTNKEEDTRILPVRHLLAIDEKRDKTLTQQALDDWYLAEQKDYETFASKYPMNGELKKQDGKIEAMRKWCDKTGISFTPTFFVSMPTHGGDKTGSFYQLPEIYSVNDLKYFLSV